MYSQKIHHKKLPSNYFSERELEEVSKKNRKHFKVGRTLFESERYALKMNDTTHKIGEAVDIDGELGIVTKVSRKGVFVQKYTSNRGFFEKTTKKPVFIPEKEYEKRAFPFYEKETVGMLFTPMKIPIRPPA